MTELTLNNEPIHSLEQLRKHFDLLQVVSYFLDGTLEQWLDEYYYEHLAEAIRKLDHEPTAKAKKDLCRFLGVDYKKHIHTSANQDNTANNQAELAALLNAGATTIYLRKNAFHIPIKKSSIHYIGLESPTMEAPFTEEQYRQAGITFTNIQLPKHCWPAYNSIAEAAAAATGYDSFGDHNSRLASYLHELLKGYRLYVPCHMEYNTESSSEFYRSKSAAESAAKEVVSMAYQQANAFFSPDSESCIAWPLARKYAIALEETCHGLLEKLRTWADRDTSHAKLLGKLEHLLTTAESELGGQFEEELQNNASYYRMYKKRYFLDSIRTVKFGGDTESFDSSVLNGLARIIHADTEYRIENLFEIIMELQEDINKHADAFFGSAQEFFQAYCKKIEAIAEEIGQKLTDKDIADLNLPDNAPEYPEEADASLPEASEGQESQPAFPD